MSFCWNIGVDLQGLPALAVLLPCLFGLDVPNQIKKAERRLVLHTLPNSGGDEIPDQHAGTTWEQQ